MCIHNNHTVTHTYMSAKGHANVNGITGGHNRARNGDRRIIMVDENIGTPISLSAFVSPHIYTVDKYDTNTQI